MVKVISKKYVKNPEALQTEIQILRKLDHPNIIKLYEVFEDEKNLYLVQEYIFANSVTAKVESSLKDSRSKAILMKRTPESSSAR